ncbi:hypothetical protein MMC06_006726 [Schaereria dolodes]|nr:hypothetical protein [Schaereria dolodes]
MADSSSSEPFFTSSASPPPRAETKAEEASSTKSDVSPQTEEEIEAGKLKAKKMASLQSKITLLESQISDTTAKKAEIAAKLKSSTPTTTVTTHIHLLHNYNAIRDIGTGLLGLIAENRGVRVRDLYGSAAATEEGEGEGDVGEFGVREGD